MASAGALPQTTKSSARFTISASYRRAWPSRFHPKGRCFEQAGRGYNGERQDWLHSVFVGVLWVSARLQPGGSDVAGGWREQLEQDLRPLLRRGERV